MYVSSDGTYVPPIYDALLVDMWLQYWIYVAVLNLLTISIACRYYTFFVTHLLSMILAMIKVFIIM